MQVPTVHDIRIRNTQDVHRIFYAVYKGILPMITRRLDAKERDALRSGCCYAWEDRGPHAITGLGIERFTEGRHWSASRVRDEFLFYYEKWEPPKSKNGEGPSNEQCPRDWDPLVKQTYSVYLENGEAHKRKWHLTAYFTQATVDQLGTVDDIPVLRDLRVPSGFFRSSRTVKSRRGAAAPSTTDSTPAHAQTASAPAPQGPSPPAGRIYAQFPSSHRAAHEAAYAYDYPPPGPPPPQHVTYSSSAAPAPSYPAPSYPHPSSYGQSDNAYAAHTPQGFTASDVFSWQQTARAASPPHQPDHTPHSALYSPLGYPPHVQKTPAWDYAAYHRPASLSPAPSSHVSSSTGSTGSHSSRSLHTSKSTSRSPDPDALRFSVIETPTYAVDGAGVGPDGAALAPIEALTSYSPYKRDPLDDRQLQSLSKIWDDVPRRALVGPDVRAIVN